MPRQNLQRGALAPPTTSRRALTTALAARRAASKHRACRTRFASVSALPLTASRVAPCNRPLLQGGLSGLYQGFLATWMRLGPWAFLFFVCFEQFRALAETML